MNVPSALLDSLTGVPGFDRQAFEEIHASGQQVTSVRLNPAKIIDASTHFQMEVTPIPYCRNGFWLPNRPSFTFDPLFHAGCYYVQEASSMFLEQALKQTVDLSQPLRVLDLCAAPGGKSTHIQSLLSTESLLVSNDVIRARANILKDNIVRWGTRNVVVTNNDPADFSRLENYFDVIVVDAPCSGSGLFRREPEAIEEWSLNNVALCSQRQQRILADVWPCLKQDGVLIYSTCSYSREEDEDIMAWIQKDLRGVGIPLKLDAQRPAVGENLNAHGGIVETKVDDAYGYRFWPYNLQGEGFFLSCFRKINGEETPRFTAGGKTDFPTRAEETFINEWIVKDAQRAVKHLNLVYSWPEVLVNDFSLLLQRIRVLYAGTLAGELMRNKMVPAHALALSSLINPGITSIDLTNEDAIRYLQRKDIGVDSKYKGWQLVTYSQHALGWINVLPNRVNNYYPKELRILKDK